MTKGGFFLALSISLVCNLTCQLFWGNRGVNALQGLRIQQDLLENQLDHMERDFNLLQDRLNRLQYSGETLMAEAGQLNYIQQGEGLIFLGNWKEIHLGLNAPEILWYQPVQQRDMRTLFRGISITLGLMVFLAKFLLSWLKTKRSDKGESQGFSHIL